MMTTSACNGDAVKTGYVTADARAFTAGLPDGFIDVTITSPPYGALKDYGSTNQIGFGQSYEEYLESLIATFGTLRNKTRDSGSLWIVVDTFKEKRSFRLLPFDLAARLRSSGWILRDIVIWNKTKTLPWSRKGQFRRLFEYILFFSKTDSFKYFIDRIKEPDDLKEWWVKYPERYSPEGKVPSTIWTYPIPVQGSWSGSRLRHFCPFPPQLVERILSLTTDAADWVCDPFAGSGIVLAQARAMKRRFVGCDLNPKYRQHFLRITNSHVGNNWKARQIEFQVSESERQRLSDIIRRLRQTKYPKSLFKELLRRSSPKAAESVTAIIAKAVPATQNGSKPVAKLFLYLICDSHSSTLLRESRKLVKRPPLSKFGIEAEVYAMAPDSFFKSKDACLLRGQPLFKYSEGRTHFAEQELRLEDLDDLHTSTWKRVPPIYINVEVRQELIKTWRKNQ
jgi:DNA modification methylase